MNSLEELNDYSDNLLEVEDERAFEIYYSDNVPNDVELTLDEGETHALPYTVQISDIISANNVSVTVVIDNDGSTIPTGFNVQGALFTQVNSWAWTANVSSYSFWPPAATIFPPVDSNFYSYQVILAHPEFPANSNVTGYSWNVEVTLNDLSEITSPVGPVDYDEDFCLSPVPGYPQITDIENPNSTVYTLEIYPSDTNALANISSTGSGSPSTDWNVTSANVYTMVGDKDELNSHLGNLTVCPAVDYANNFILSYELTGIGNITTIVTQAWEIDVLNSETSNLGIDRSYYSNQVNTLYNSPVDYRALIFAPELNGNANISGNVVTGFTVTGNGFVSSGNTFQTNNYKIDATLDGNNQSMILGFVSTKGVPTSTFRAFYFTDNTTVLTSRVGANDVVISNSYSPGDSISIEYTGGNWNFYHNASLERTVSDPGYPGMFLHASGGLNSQIGNIKIYDNAWPPGSIGNAIPQITESVSNSVVYTVNLTLGSNIGQIHPVGNSSGWNPGTLTYTFMGTKDEVNTMLSNIAFQPNKNVFSQSTIQYRQYRGNVLQTNDTVDYVGINQIFNNDQLYTFNADADIDESLYAIPNANVQTYNYDLLICAGGGGGAQTNYTSSSNYTSGGGGGAGGIIIANATSWFRNAVQPGQLELTLHYDIGIGAGAGAKGQNSFVYGGTAGFGRFDFICPGGGFGSAVVDAFAGAGGSGGGGAYQLVGPTASTGSGGNVESTSSNIAHLGFSGGSGSISTQRAGGGGGASGAGSANTAGGAGGGIVSNITGSAIEYCRGGRAGHVSASEYGTPQFTGFGSGGDGGWDNVSGGSPIPGNAGRDGIMYIRQWAYSGPL